MAGDKKERKVTYVGEVYNRKGTANNRWLTRPLYNSTWYGLWYGTGGFHFISAALSGGIIFHQTFLPGG